MKNHYLLWCILVRHHWLGGDDTIHVINIRRHQNGHLLEHAKRQTFKMDDDEESLSPFVVHFGSPSLVGS